MQSAAVKELYLSLEVDDLIVEGDQGAMEYQERDSLTLADPCGNLHRASLYMLDYDSREVRTMNNNVQLHLCFDGVGREIEVLDVKRISKETMRIMENPIFSSVVSYGDIIRVREDRDIFYYLETVQKSDLVRHSWLLSKEATESQEIEDFKNKIIQMNGNWEQVFGGFLIVNIPADRQIGLDDSIRSIIEKLG